MNVWDYNCLHGFTIFAASAIRGKIADKRKSTCNVSLFTERTPLKLGFMAQWKVMLG
jgi:hypothetical protein